MSGSVIHRLLESPQIDYLDLSEGQRALSCAVGLLNKISLVAGDYAARCAMVLEHFRTNLRVHKDDDDQFSNSGLHIRSRGLVSIVYDCLWRFEQMKKRRSQQQGTVGQAINDNTNGSTSCWDENHLLFQSTLCNCVDALLLTGPAVNNDYNTLPNNNVPLQVPMSQTFQESVYDDPMLTGLDWNFDAGQIFPDMSF